MRVHPKGSKYSIEVYPIYPVYRTIGNVCGELAVVGTALARSDGYRAGLEETLRVPSCAPRQWRLVFLQNASMRA